MVQCRSRLYTLGPNVGIVYRHGALGISIKGAEDEEPIRRAHDSKTRLQNLAFRVETLQIIADDS